jgi:tetratricopeptide (TPR) repeat protein
MVARNAIKIAVITICLSVGLSIAMGAASRNKKPASHTWESLGIREEWSPDHARITVQDTLGKTGFRYFTLPDPPRMVVDVPHPARRVPVDSLPLRDGLFHRLRVGHYPDKLRYVLDLSGDDVHCSGVARKANDLIIEARRRKHGADPQSPDAAVRSTRTAVPASSETAIVSASLPPSAAAAQQRDLPRETIQQEIHSTTDSVKLAALYKQLGDHYVSQDKIEDGSSAYIEALSFSRERFSVHERLRMAIHISWTDQLDEAIEELRLICRESPNSLEARTHLARALSWKGNLAEAIQEADNVLQESPDDLQARIVKADALQWQGRYMVAIPVYREVLERGENFEARKGLSYCLLALKDPTGAKENRRMLKPASPRERREATKLSKEIDALVRPRLDFFYGHYTDSDDNDVDRFGMSFAWWIWNFRTDLHYRHTEARDGARDGRAEDAAISVYTSPAPMFGIGGGLGFNQVKVDESADSLTGHFELDFRVFKGNLGGIFSSEILTDTAELMENRIRMTTAGFSVYQALSGRISLFGGYQRKFFSDENRAHDVHLSSEYKVALNPHIRVGYRFRFLDFERQSFSGFFDPDDYIANRFFSSLYLDRKPLYVYSEFFLGHQHFYRYGALNSDFIFGGAGSLGLRPIEKIYLEFYVDGGNNAAGSVTGFNYVTFGPRILVNF